MQRWNPTDRSSYIHHAFQPRARRRVHGPLRPRRPGGDEPDQHHLLQRLLLLARQAVQGVHDPAWRRHRADAAVRPVPAARRAGPRPGAAAGRQLPRFLGARRAFRGRRGLRRLGPGRSPARRAAAVLPRVRPPSRPGRHRGRLAGGGAGRPRPRRRPHRRRVRQPAGRDPRRDPREPAGSRDQGLLQPHPPHPHGEGAGRARAPAHRLPHRRGVGHPGAVRRPPRHLDPGYGGRVPRPGGARGGGPRPLRGLRPRPRALDGTGRDPPSRTTSSTPTTAASSTVTAPTAARPWRCASRARRTAPATTGCATR